MENDTIIKKTIDYISSLQGQDSSGHDWWHTYRVWQLAKKIGGEENVNLFIVEIAALLHDIADYKFHGGDLLVGPQKAKEWLNRFNIDQKTIKHICGIIQGVSFKGARIKDQILTEEGKVVQDADRLDAIGAIGIARVFAFGGNKRKIIFDPRMKPVNHKTAESYLFNRSSSINHFYEKLLLLKDRMNTNCGKRMAQGRHDFMMTYLDRFFQEWEGNL